MKTVRIVSVILILAMLCCSFIACSTTEENVELPERPFHNIKVSFQIKSDSGKTIVNAENYNYKGHEDPTILNIITDYLAIEANFKYTVDENNIITKIGSTKAGKNEYWSFTMKGVDLDMQTILGNLVNKQMSEYIVEDGAAFTVVLVSNK
ncbi:MAG: hypothetical protein E7592_02555 [Ruminococcaceae bacterium]|nr:hypothetical protein [Oscillospiraceae bacterium]